MEEEPHYMAGASLQAAGLLCTEPVEDWATQAPNRNAEPDFTASCAWSEGEGVGLT